MPIYLVRVDSTHLRPVRARSGLLGAIYDLQADGCVSTLCYLPVHNILFVNERGWRQAIFHHHHDNSMCPAALRA